MPKKTQAKGNAFYWFMQSILPDLKREGRVFPNGLADVVPVAHPRFKALSPQEKEKFEKMAKDYKAKMRGVEGDKYRQDNVGNIISDRIDKPTEERKKRDAQMKILKSRWPLGEKIMDYKFYLINFQTLCRTEAGDYLPCEVALVEFSLREGITKIYQKFVHPGQIPLGYRYTCQSNSDETHQIPVSGFELADDNYRGLWIQMENFVNPSGEKHEYPPLFCMNESTECVEYCTQWIHAHACVGMKNRLDRIFSLETMVSLLSAHNGGIKVSETQIADILTSTAFDYEPNTRCEWHEERETRFCALAICRRYCYSISDAMAAIYNFELIPNRHVPSRSVQPVQRVDPAALGNQPSWITNPSSASRRAGDSNINQSNSNSGPFASTDYRLNEPPQEEEEPQQTMRRPNLPSMASGFGNAPWGKPPATHGISAAAAGHVGQPAEYGVMDKMVSKKVKQKAEQHLGQYDGEEEADEYYAVSEPTPAWSTQSTGSRNPASLDIGDSEEFPSLGGTPARKPQQSQNTQGGVRFAGRAGPPPPASAPQPPVSWQQPGPRPSWGPQPTNTQSKTPWGPGSVHSSGPGSVSGSSSSAGYPMTGSTSGGYGSSMGSLKDGAGVPGSSASSDVDYPASEVSDTSTLKSSIQQPSTIRSWGPQKQGAPRTWGPGASSTTSQQTQPLQQQGQPLQQQAQPSQQPVPQQLVQQQQPMISRPLPPPQAFGGIGRGRGRGVLANPGMPTGPGMRAGATPPRGGATRAGAGPPGANLNHQMAGVSISQGAWGSVAQQPQ